MEEKRVGHVRENLALRKGDDPVAKRKCKYGKVKSGKRKGQCRKRRYKKRK